MTWRMPTRLHAVLTLLLSLLAVSDSTAQTALGELEGRAAPVTRRQCIAGTNAGSLCNENSDCPGSACRPTNIFNISIAVQFNATAAQLTTIREAITDGSAILFDATDGQAQIGQAAIHNNAFGTAADVRVYPATRSRGWSADTGNWKTGGRRGVAQPARPPHPRGRQRSGGLPDRVVRIPGATAGGGALPALSCDLTTTAFARAKAVV